MSRQYHKDYQHIDKQAVEAVREAIKLGLFKQANPVSIKEDIIKKLHTKLCNIYHIQENKLIFSNEIYGLGYYDKTTHDITINKPSLVTYLHEFCHYYMHISNQPNDEDTARGWSISLYYLAAPKLCKNAIEKGLILHQSKFEESGNVQH